MTEEDLMVRRALCSNGNYLEWGIDGIGHLPSNGFVYDEHYWDKYQALKGQPIDIALTNFRSTLVKKYLNPTARIVDVGVGNCHFVEDMREQQGFTMCYGTDINPRAREYLQSKDMLLDPGLYSPTVHALTFWDSLEHFDDPKEFIWSAGAQFLFVSLPIHESFESCLASKHLRPDEHIWHFTRDGFSTYMNNLMYETLEVLDEETKIGRESILTYVLRKM